MTDKITQTITITDDEIFYGKGKQVNKCLDEWCKLLHHPDPGLNKGDQSFNQKPEQLCLPDKTILGTNLKDTINKLPLVSKPDNLIKIIINGNQSSQRPANFDDTPSLKLTDDSRIDKLLFENKPFDINLLKFDTEESECGIIYYDGEIIVSNDEEPVLEFFNQILCENAWACGCGMPDHATTFFLKQLLGLKTGIDYHSLPGGLDLFKIACYEVGIINDKFELTNKGNELINLFNYFDQLQFPNLHVIEPKVELTPSNINLKPLTDGEATKALVFQKLNYPIPQHFETAGALLYIGIFASFLNLRSEEWNDATKPVTIQNMWSVYQKAHYGETYNTLHILDNLLELEEHGGSTPGWLQHTEHAMQSLIAIEKLYGVKELFKLYLGDNNENSGTS